ncbi:MAG: RagB/SusD family nutrient uptake outer membrane protein [Sphingobacteriales bacterium]|jgi:starch-binding outer membrane protein, SusD/RagB family|nr:MAG: RagB/SusD family nutrient uptake outer membrane protein [Sphingobacteriales bacterium]
MKKTYKFIPILVFVVITALSCKKQLELTPEDTVIELTNFKAINNALIGCYAGFKADGYYNNPASSGSGSGWSALPDLMGDDMVETMQSLGNWRVAGEMKYKSDNGIVLDVFGSAYEVISRANNILQVIDPYIQDNLTKEKAQIIKAQLLAIRAHAHFDLLRYFAVDFGRNSTNLGIPYVTKFNPVNPLANLPPRNTVKENYDAIFSDYNASLTLFREAGDVDENPIRNYIDSTVVHAMLARVNYYTSNWAEAAKQAEIVLENNGLANESQFLAMYSADGEKNPPTELVWAIPSDNALTPGAGINGRSPAFRVTESLYQKMNNLGGVYMDASIINSSAANSVGFRRRRLQKYASIKSFKVFRAGEMVLIKAEAEQKLGNNVAALATLNELRTKRGLDEGTETGSALLDAILLLRRIELIGEGHRWFDLKRTTRNIVRGECGTAQFSLSTTCTIDPSSKAWVFPIPFNDKLVNPNLVQNPGY